MVQRIRVSNSLELKLAVESYEPASEAKQEFCEGWVDVEVVFAKDIVCGKFPKMDFVEALWRTRQGRRRVAAAQAYHVQVTRQRRKTCKAIRETHTTWSG